MRRHLIRFGAVMAVVVLFFFVIRPAWYRVCGNLPIAFHGRVVDSSGRGIQGVYITFEGLYSNVPLVPVWTDKRWRKTVSTDRNGNFALTGVYGQSVRFAAGTRIGNRRIHLFARDLTPENDPAYGVGMNNRSSRMKLPDTSDKRVVYQVVGE